MKFLRIKFKYIGLLLVLSIMLSCNNDGIVLVQQGKTDYELVYMGNATESQYKSAESLQHYLYLIEESHYQLSFQVCR